jgi:SAM-dependent methyltransferase
MTFYGPDQAAIHHQDFGNLAAAAATRLLGELATAGHRSGTVVDLGSGSGILARILSEAGYDVLGVDISPAMVELARRHAPRATFVCASLHDVELPPAVAVTAIGEALSYATDARAGLTAIASLLSKVRGALAPGGVVLGDVAMPGRVGPDKLRLQIHDRPDWTLHMRAEESTDGTTLDRAIAIFRRTGPDTYQRTDEHHVLRLYSAEQLREVFAANGFTVELLDGYADRPSSSTPAAGWAVFVARPGSAAPATG